MIDVERFRRHSTLRSARGLDRFRRAGLILAVLAVCSSTVPVLARPAYASGITSEQAKAATLYAQIQSINSRVELLGQKYDEAQIRLQQITHRIKNTKNVITNIEKNVAQGNIQLKVDTVLAYVTYGSAARNNPLFLGNTTKTDATNVYSELAQGNISATLASLKNYKIHLTQERSILIAADRQATDATRAAARSFHEAKLLLASLQRALGQAKGQIAYFIRQQVAAAAAKSAEVLRSARPVTGFPAPPPNSRAAIAIRAALSFVGVPYAWGGASRNGVDCSGLIMLAYAAAGVFLPHYSGAQYTNTVRVPLYDLQPGDLLFYGWHGDEHEAMYVGHGKMIEAEHTGTRVLVTDVRLGYGFTGVGRPQV